MSIKRLALCRSQGRLFVLLRFVGQDIARLIEQEAPRFLLTRRPMGHACRPWHCRSITAACLRFVPPLPIMSASLSSWCFRLWTALQLTFHLRPAVKAGLYSL